jgi:hypothetical protein
VYFLDVYGVVVYVGPLETYFGAGGGMREVAIVHSNHHPIFLRLFVEFAYRYENQLFLAEQNNNVLMASNMNIMHASNKLSILDLYIYSLNQIYTNCKYYLSESFDSTDATTQQFDPHANCLQFDIFEGKDLVNSNIVCLYYMFFHSNYFFIMS